MVRSNPYQAGLEIVPQYHYQQAQHEQPQYNKNFQDPSTPPIKPEQASERTILGIRRTTFLLSAALVIVVIAAAVGGGVGGSMAAMSTKSSACDKSIAATATVTAATTVTAIVTSDATGTATSDGLVVPTGVVALDCPSLNNVDQIITLSESASTFEPTCGTNYYGADIVSVISYSFNDCLRGCASMNYFLGNTTCAAVTFVANQTYQIPENYGNCFLKTGTGRTDTGLGNGYVSATLTSNTT
ncbi:hypothetical protein G7054_g7011 [Neopestalotiopsis clavispora]|nr:hypothetical protein G7054_g7011 [Neopestalotiopsis clavispora]